MNASSTLRLQGSLLRWIGLITLAVAIMGGLLGMHVIGSAQAAPMASTEISSVLTAADVTGADDSDAAHPAVPATMTASDHGEVSDASNHLGNTAVRGCSPSGTDMPIASHGACIPFAGAATPAAPQPGLAPDPAAGPATSGHGAQEYAGRLPDAPSLTQLSISRT